MYSPTQDNILEPVDANNAKLSPTLGIGATFTSKWYTRSRYAPRLIAHFYGSQALAANGLVLRESFDPAQPGTPVTHEQTTAASAAETTPEGAVNIAHLEIRVIGNLWQVAVTNGATQQAGARLFIITSTASGS